MIWSLRCVGSNIGPHDLPPSNLKNQVGNLGLLHRQLTSHSRANHGHARRFSAANMAVPIDS